MYDVSVQSTRSCYSMVCPPVHVDTWVDPEMGDRGSEPNPLESHKLIYVSLEILVRSPFLKQVQLLLEGGLYGPL